MNRSVMQLWTAKQSANAQLQLQTQQNQAVQKPHTNVLKPWLSQLSKGILVIYLCGFQYMMGLRKKDF